MKRSFLRVMALLLAVSVLTPMSALARDRGRHRGWDRSHRADVYHRRPVPMVLYASERRDFRPYYRGEVWYRPHHHYHLAYRLPVYVNGVVVYRPYYYCEHRLFVAASAPVPRLAIGVEFHN